MKFSKTFNALANEATFTRDMLGAGVTQIRKANYAEKGIYFQAFTSLSTGLERIGKLCVILDNFIANKGVFPSLEKIKNNIGHDLIKLHAYSKDIVSKYNIQFELTKKSLGEIHLDILKLLSDFGSGDRYSNIDLIVKGNKQSDPTSTWFKKVDSIIFENKVSKRKKDKITFNAKVIDTIMGPYSSVLHTSELGEEINSVKNASFLTGMTEAVAPYRQLYVLQIIRYWVEILWKLQNIAMKIEGNDIPYFSEIFALFYNKDSYFRTRKTFSKIR